MKPLSLKKKKEVAEVTSDDGVSLKEREVDLCLCGKSEESRQHGISSAWKGFGAPPPYSQLQPPIGGGWAAEKLRVKTGRIPPGESFTWERYVVCCTSAQLDEVLRKEEHSFRRGQVFLSDGVSC